MAQVGGQQGQPSFGILTGLVTIARECWSRNGGACRADEVPDCRMRPADRSKPGFYRLQPQGQTIA